MILVSACLLGENVKYSGGNNACQLLIKYKAQNKYLVVCPECLGQLTIPRPPAELKGGSGKDVLLEKAFVLDKEGKDVSKNFLLGAEKVLALCQKNNIKTAILKENSPSCGSTHIYNGNFEDIKIPGAGVTAALLQEHGIKVYSEKNITESILKELIK